MGAEGTGPIRQGPIVVEGMDVAEQAEIEQWVEEVEKEEEGDFPGGAVVKNPPANAGNMGSSPGPGRSHMPRSN